MTRFAFLLALLAFFYDVQCLKYYTSKCSDTKLTSIGKQSSPFLGRKAIFAVTNTPSELIDDSIEGEISGEKVEGLEYDWKKQWYALCFEENLAVGSQPTAASVFGKPLVLWKSNDTLFCVEDRFV